MLMYAFNRPIKTSFTQISVEMLKLLQLNETNMPYSSTNQLKPL